MFDPVTRLLELTGPRPRIALAFSGGLDSTVLAHALAAKRRQFAALRLLHVDHGLQAASHDWSRHCARVARRLRVPFVALDATVRRKRGESPEAAAREARYALLAMVLDRGEVLVTAQHRDDQVETLLLQLFRGAGVAGLASMPAITTFAAGRICRPLLDVPRADLAHYARERRLEWVEDPTNMETQFARNFLRAKVLPVIRQQWKGFDAAVARSARHMAEASKLLHGLGRADYARVADGDGVNVAQLRALSLPRRRNALRVYIASLGVESPPTAQLSELSGPLLTARSDAQPEVRWQGAVVRRRAGRLVLHVKSEEASDARNDLASKSWDWNSDRVCILSDSGRRLELLDDAAGPIDLDLLPHRLEIRARSGGEALRPGPKARLQALKKLIQAARMTVEERAHLPLLFSGKRLIAAGDRWIDASILANDKSRRRARLRWSRAR
jgi:tRNA(Ile)-lysidine synthase